MINIKRMKRGFYINIDNFEEWIVYYSTKFPSCMSLTNGMGGTIMQLCNHARSADKLHRNDVRLVRRFV